MAYDDINEELKKLPATQYDMAHVTKKLSELDTHMQKIIDRPIFCDDHEERIRRTETRSNLIWGALLFIAFFIPFIFI